MKPIILVFTRFYLPGYLGGGPIRTIANMVERLGNEFDFRIVTTDRDVGLYSEPYQGIQVDKWNMVGKAQVFYASHSTLSSIGLVRLMSETKYDLLYLNSFFDFKFSIKLILLLKINLIKKSPVIIAPRGEFSLGAFKIKIWKKLPFIWFVILIKLYKEVIWHASSPFEVSDINRVMMIDSNLCRVAPNIPNLNFQPDLSFPDKSTHFKKNDDCLRVCFLSRISSKKNLDFGLKVLSDVSVPVQFDIYGPKESSVYWEECLKLISELPSNISVSYVGALEHSKVCETIAKYEIFFLPTRGENFGHVFIESWMAGVPVLISDQTPWRDLEIKKLGWDISLDKPDKFVTILNNYKKMNYIDRIAVRKSCFEFASEQVNGQEAIILNRNLFSIPYKKTIL